MYIPKDNIEPDIRQKQSYKNKISIISSKEMEIIFGLLPTDNIQKFNHVLSILSNNTLDNYIETTKTDENVTKTPNKNYSTLKGIPICPDFLDVLYSGVTTIPNIYEMKARMRKKEKKTPHITMNIEQFLKYHMQSKLWKSDFISLFYIYTFEKDIKTIIDDTEILTNIGKKDIIMIPSDYLIENNDSFTKCLDRYDIDMENINNIDINELIKLKKILKNETKNKAAYFTLPQKEISSILNMDIENVYQKQISTPSQPEITFSCVENGKTMDLFFKDMVKRSKKNIAQTDINQSIFNMLNTKSPNNTMQLQFSAN